MVVRALSAASRRVSATLISSFIATVLFVLLPGCDKDQDDRIQVQAEYFGDTSRPSEITVAYTSLHGGQVAHAYATAQGFIDSHPGSPYLPEAQYICGLALCGQGQYDDGKDRLEIAIDKTHDRNLKALAMLGRADCNMGLEKYSLASRQYHWIEVKYKDVKPLHQDEVMFKLGLASKKAGNSDWADYWFNQVNELYHTGPYAERARQENSHFSPAADSREKPLVYFLEADAFSSQEKAEAGAANLRAKGYKDVEVVQSTRNSFKVYEIHIGKFTSKADAGRAQVDAHLAGLSTTLRPGTVEPIK